MSETATQTLNEELLKQPETYTCPICGKDGFSAAHYVERHVVYKHGASNGDRAAIGMMLRNEGRDLRGYVYDPYKDIHLGMFKDTFEMGMEQAFGPVRGLIAPQFRRAAQDCIDRHFPLLRRSAARVVVEGAIIEGGKPPWGSIPSAHAEKLRQTLAVHDVLETMWCDYLRESPQTSKR